MSITNNAGLPNITYDAIKPSNSYIPCGSADYSATSLVTPPRQLQLVKRHRKEIKEDAADMWARFMGDAIHAKFEKELSRYPEKYLVERKITRFDKDRRVVAKFDAYDVTDNTLYDHKTMNVTGYGLEAKDEYIGQLNINAHFLRQEGFKVDSGKLNMIYLGWSAYNAKYQSADKYPPIPNMEVDVPIWSDDEKRTYYEQRLAAHIAAEGVSDDALPECTPEECWERPAKYAIWKTGGKRAVKLCDTVAEVESYAKWRRFKPSEYYVEERKGTRLRCDQYCTAAPFCSQYQKWLEDNGVLDEDIDNSSDALD